VDTFTNFSNFSQQLLITSSYVAILFYILLASWSLLPLRVGFLKPLLVGTKRHKLGLVQRVGALTFSWC
jgi:hypothetical protein